MSSPSGTDRRWAQYQDILAGDRVPAPADMRVDTRPDLGLGGPAIERYISSAYGQLEAERLWTRVWQFACREEEIPEVGDIHVYELGNISVLVVRCAPQQIKAFVNSCLHRGTTLCSVSTSVHNIRCPFHGFTWSLDGRLKEVPCRWDFPHIDDESHSLPEVRVGRWGGFVFINMDPAAPPLERYLEDLPRQLQGSHYERQYIAGYYRKSLACNWKAAIEAFIEAFHAVETHFHTAKISDEINTQYDIQPGARNVSRFQQPIGVKPTRLPELNEQDVLDEIFAVTQAGPAPRLPPGVSARAFVAEQNRQAHARATGSDGSGISDAEAIDSLQYLLFPNAIFFRGIAVPAVYRFRPNGSDVNSSIFDLLVMRVVPEGQSRPEAAEPLDIGAASFEEAATALPKWLGRLYDQDVANLGRQQRGMRASVRPNLTLSRYQEVRIRHLHQTLDRYINPSP